MKADSWNAKTFQDSIEQEPTTQIESNRAEYRLPAKDVLSSTESAEVVKLLQSLTLYTSNRNLYDSIFGEGELLLELRSPITVDLFLERYPFPDISQVPAVRSATDQRKEASLYCASALTRKVLRGRGLQRQMPWRW